MSLEIRLQQALGDRRIAAYSVEELLPAVNTVLRQVLVKQQAMAILLKRFFDRLIREEKELFGKMAA